MRYTAKNTGEQGERTGSVTPPQAAGEGRKGYTPPQIEDFGRIADLTLTLNNLSPGDFAGGSFST